MGSQSKFMDFPDQMVVESIPAEGLLVAFSWTGMCNERGVMEARPQTKIIQGEHVH